MFRVPIIILCCVASLSRMPLHRSAVEHLYESLIAKRLQTEASFTAVALDGIIPIATPFHRNRHRNCNTVAGINGIQAFPTGDKGDVFSVGHKPRADNSPVCGRTE